MFRIRLRFDVFNTLILVKQITLNLFNAELIPFIFKDLVPSSKYGSRREAHEFESQRQIVSYETILKTFTKFVYRVQKKGNKRPTSSVAEPV